MANNRVINMGAGPSCLPLNVLEEAQAGLLDYGQTGIGLTELSHRSKTFQDLNTQVQTDLSALLKIPENFKILFLQGGGLTQFATVPLNLLAWYRIQNKLSVQENPVCDYLVTGSWSAKAVSEAKLLGCNVNVVVDGKKASKDGKAFGNLPSESDYKWSTSGSKPAFIYYCANETVNGVEIDPPTVPEALKGVPLAVDMSSNILSKPIPWSEHNFGLIYAGAQKNIAPSGLTIVIIRKDLLVDLNEAVQYGGARTPSMLSYKTLADNDSLYNTPPMFPIYIAGLVIKDLIKNGGLDEKEKVNIAKAKKVYDLIDHSSGFYVSKVEPHLRSRMNVVFVCKGGEETDGAFVKGADKAGIKQIKGHR